MSRVFRILAGMLLAAGLNLAQAGALDGISNGDAAAGVREALAKGADYAVASLGKENGFLGNDKVKIPLPGYLEQAESGLRMLGFGKQADQLVETMNHAAEQAAAQAKPILVASIKKMSLQDAKVILTGGDDSVTQYFRRTTSEELTAKFMPIVKKSTARLKLADKYNQIAGKAAGLGLVDQKDANLDSYVTDKAMEGLFTMIAEEERKLRANPLEAGSSLLKKVFGAL